MKISTIMAVFAVGVAVAASGCKYSKAGSGEAAAGNADLEASTAQDIGSEVPEVDEGKIDENGQDGSLADLANAGKMFDELYQRCTDVSFSPVYFGFDTSVVPQGELGKIEAVAAHLKDNADRVVIIEGNCDERGSNGYNMSLGENRAMIVRNYLAANGIADDRIQTRSNGEEKPAEQGTGEEVWSKNRRGEFLIFQK